jgi:hypothetical protein
MSRGWMTSVWLCTLACGPGAEGPDPVEDLGLADASVPWDADLQDADREDSSPPVDDAGTTPSDLGLPDPSDAGVPNDWSELSAALSDHCRRCHDGGRRRRVDRWTDLVGVEALQVRAPLVAPGDPDGSYLLAKLSGTHGDFCGRAGQPMANCGRRMPPEGAAPSPEQQLRLRAWIGRGAPAE